MSDTPRTDAKERESVNGCTDFKGAMTHAHYGWKFARALEREAQSRTRELEAEINLAHARMGAHDVECASYFDGEEHAEVFYPSKCNCGLDAILTGDKADE